MGRKDYAQNDYFSSKERFADVCNGVLFQGEKRIKPQELQEVDADIVYREQNKLRKIIPDKVRMWHGVYLSILSLETQSIVDYKMVFRIMKEEAVYYERQWRRREERYKREGRIGKKDKLHWKGKGERFAPVITIVLYLGTDMEWDAATCLYDMLNMDERLEPYVTNFKINFFDYRECKDFSIFKTENRELFEILSCTDSEEKMNELFADNRDRYDKLIPEVMETILDIAGIEKKEIITESEKEENGMCKAWDDHKERGRMEGRLEGRLEGKIEGNMAAISNLMEEFKISIIEAMRILKIEESEQELYVKMIQ